MDPWDVALLPLKLTNLLTQHALQGNTATRVRNSPGSLGRYLQLVQPPRADQMHDTSQALQYTSRQSVTKFAIPCMPACQVSCAVVPASSTNNPDNYYWTDTETRGDNVLCLAGLTGIAEPWWPRNFCPASHTPRTNHEPLSTIQHPCTYLPRVHLHQVSKGEDLSELYLQTLGENLPFSDRRHASILQKQLDVLKLQMLQDRRDDAAAVVSHCWIAFQHDYA